ncbi:MAG: ABC transporter transmembrane domain-containing protein [Pseudomonadota bacterium]
MKRSSSWRRRDALYSLILRQTFGLQALTIALGLTLPPLVIAPLHIQQRLIDDALPAADMALLQMLVLAYVGAVLLTGAVKFSVTWLRGWMAEIVSRVLRAALIEAQRKRPSSAAHASLGSATSVLVAEVDPLGGFAAEALNTPLVQGATMLGVIGFMAYTEPALAAIGVAALVFEAILTPIVQIRINRLTADRIQALRRAGFDVIDAAEAHRPGCVVAGLGEIRRAYWIRLRMNLLKAGLKVARNLIDHAADIAVLALGATMAMRGETEIGVIVAFLSGLRELRGPWGELLDFYRRFADARIKYRLVIHAIAGGADPKPAAVPTPLDQLA